MDFQAEFNRIIENSNLEDLTEEVQVGINLFDIARVLEQLQEASMHITRYCMKVIAVPRGEPVPFPAELMSVLPQLAGLSAETSDILHVLVCDDCLEDEFEDDDED